MRISPKLFSFAANLRLAARLGLAILVGVPSAASADLVACRTETSVPVAVRDALDQILEDSVDPDGQFAAQLGYAPGAVLSVRGPDWWYASAAGVVDTETDVPPSCNMPFQIGSNTKMMTATVLLQLQEEGKLTLSDRLSQFLPEIAARLPFGDRITLAQLAQHTSGVFSYTDNAPDGAPGIMEGALEDPELLRKGYTPLELVEFVIAHGQPTFEPGAKNAWSYSNTGYVLLGMIIEGIEGVPLEKVLTDRIFDPLEMADTFFWNGVPDEAFGLPRAYFTAPFDIETSDWNMSQGWAAGAVISTSEDMHRFIEALLGGELFRSPETLASMQQTMETGSLTAPEYGYGLARKAEGVWGHGGQTLGFESDVAFAEGSDISIVGWTNSANSPMVLGAAIVAAVLSSSGEQP